MSNELAAHIRRVWSVSARPEGLDDDADCKGIEINYTFDTQSGLQYLTLLSLNTITVLSLIL